MLIVSSQENCGELEELRMLWIVDYLNIHKQTSDCLIVEADSYDEAHELAIEELKILKIPKRYLLKMEEF